MRKRRLTYTLILVSLLVFSCIDTGELNLFQDEDSFSEMNVDEQFGYQTTKEKNLKIKLPGSVDYSDYRSKIGIYTKPENAGGALS